MYDDVGRIMMVRTDKDRNCVRGVSCTDSKRSCQGEIGGWKYLRDHRTSIAAVVGNFKRIISPASQVRDPTVRLCCMWMQILSLHTDLMEKTKNKFEIPMD